MINAKMDSSISRPITVKVVSHVIVTLMVRYYMQVDVKYLFNE